MKPSPLQLHYLLFDKVSVEVNDDFKSTESDDVLHWELFDFNGVNFETGVQADETDGKGEPEYVVSLGLRISSKDGKPTPYLIDVKVTGYFSVLSKTISSDERSQFVTVNGCSLLYGAIREQVANITSRGSRGPIFLPTVNFLDLKKDLAEKVAAEEATKA